jgi:hypothetical protein
MALAPAPARGQIASVPAAAETEPVASALDAADDPAIWVHPADPALSLVIGTDKQAGVYVYDLAGAERQFVATGGANNVDVDADGLVDYGPDPGCSAAWDPTERQGGCGLGFEIALALAALRLRAGPRLLRPDRAR